jgi:hypothetical protein
VGEGGAQQEAGRKLGHHMLAGMRTEAGGERPHLRHDLMADAVHPNVKGFQALGREVESLISSCLGEAENDSHAA